MYRPAIIVASFVVVAIASAIAGYGKGYAAGKANVQQAWDKEKAVQLSELSKQQQEFRQKEVLLQKKSDQIRREKDREVRDLNARNAALSNILREREARPINGRVSETTGAGSGSCTGKELYREDGEFLVRFSREADEMRIALKQCYLQYNSAIDSR